MMEHSTVANAFRSTNRVNRPYNLSEKEKKREATTRRCIQDHFSNHEWNSRADKLLCRSFRRSEPQW